MIYVAYDFKMNRHDIAVSGVDDGNKYFKVVAHIDNADDAELFMQALHSLYGQILNKKEVDDIEP